MLPEGNIRDLLRLIVLIRDSANHQLEKEQKEVFHRKSEEDVFLRGGKLFQLCRAHFIQRLDACPKRAGGMCDIARNR